MSYPVFYKKHNSFRVALYGKRLRKDRSLPLFFNGDPEKVCLIKAASNETQPGFGRILEPVYGKTMSDERDMFADATILTERRSSATIFTADCCGLVVYEATSHSLGLAHCGRAAMTPQNQLGDEIDNMVTRLMTELSKRARGTPEFVAVTTGSISPQRFTHDKPEAKELILPFKQFGSVAFTDEEKGELDITGIVRKQLLDLGIRPENITHDDLCTYESEELYSYRQACNEDLDTTKRNALVVVLN